MNAVAFPALEYYEIDDPFGITPPSFTVSGSVPNQSVVATLNSSSSTALNYTVKFLVDVVGG